MPLLDAGSFLVGQDTIKYLERPLDALWGEVNSHGGGASDPSQDQFDRTP